MKRVVFTLFVLSFFSVLTVQKTAYSMDINYLNNSPPPSDKPVVFAPGVISSKEYWEEKIAFTADGKEIFFGRHADPDDYFNPKVMHLKLKDKKWLSPQVASFSIDRKMGWPMISGGSDKLFMEEFEGKIFFSQKHNGKWSDAKQIIPDVIVEKGFGLAQMTKDNTFYFHDRWGRVAYSSKVTDGKYSKPQALPYMINPSVEFFVSPDNDYIIFQPLDWKNQLHISYRNNKNQWQIPIPFETYFDKNKWNCKGIGPSISPDGKYLFFGHKGDIYWIKTDFIEVLKKYKRKY